MSARARFREWVAPPPRNVGGGDLVTRTFAIVAMLALVGMLAPQAEVSFTLLKILLLITAELGLVSLMLGLFLRSNTYFAGIQLFVASLMMLWLTAREFPRLAMVIGLLFIAVGITNVITRRSRFNVLMRVNSLKGPADDEDVATGRDPSNEALKSLAQEGPR